MPKIATINSNNASYTVTDGLYKKSHLFSNCTTNLIPNSDGSKTFYLVSGNETVVVISNTINTEHFGNIVFGATSPDIAQTNAQGYIGASSGASASSGVTVRVLANPGGTSYTQSQLQSLYDNQIGLAAPDTVPQAVTDYANSLNSPGYKVYLGQNTWFYTNISNTITTASWLVFGGGKSAFGAVIVPTGIITYK